MFKKYSHLFGNSSLYIAIVVLMMVYFVKVDLSLVYFINQPFFSNTALFFKSYLLYPRGISNYISLFIVQFYGQNTWAIILAGSQIILLWIVMHQLFKQLLPKYFTNILVVLFSLPLIMEQANYIRLPEFLVPTLISAVFSLFYLKINRYSASHLPFYLVFALLIFYVSGIYGLSLFFATNTCFAVDAKQYKYILFYGLLSSLPTVLWYSFGSLFTTISDTLSVQFITFKPTADQWMVNLIPALLLVLFLCLYYINQAIKKPENRIFQLLVSLLVFSISALTIFKMGYSLPLKKGIEIDKMAVNRDWNQLLKLDVAKLDNKYTMSHLYRALYHNDMLLEQLFHYPLTFNQDALIIHESIDAPEARLLADIYFDLGLINESRHWANEALTSMGFHPNLLKRLIECYLISGHYGAAEKYLNFLATSPVNRKWVNSKRKFLYRDSCVEADEKYGDKRKLNPGADFFMDYTNPYGSLSALMYDTVPNKMVFEYYLAYNLFRKNSMAVWQQIPHFHQRGYQRLPKACQESILFFKATSGISSNVDLFGYTYDAQISTDFDEFTSIVFDQYKGDFKTARSALNKFKNTYWYYFLYADVKGVTVTINGSQNYLN